METKDVKTLQVDKKNQDKNPYGLVGDGLSNQSKTTTKIRDILGQKKP